MARERNTEYSSNLQLLDTYKKIAAQEGVTFAQPASRQQSGKKGCIARLAQWLKNNRNAF